MLLRLQIACVDGGAVEAAERSDELEAPFGPFGVAMAVADPKAISLRHRAIWEESAEQNAIAALEQAAAARWDGQALICHRSASCLVKGTTLRSERH